LNLYFFKTNAAVSLFRPNLQNHIQMPIAAPRALHLANDETTIG